MRFGKFVGSFKVGVGGAVLAVALAGCAEPTPTGKLPDPPSSAAPSAADSSATSSSAVPGTSAAPTTTYTPEEQAVIDQYKGYQMVPSGLKFPSADQVRGAYAPYAIEPVVENWVTVFADMESEGVFATGSVTFGPISVVITGNDAELFECRDGSGETITRESDGVVVSRGTPGMRFEAGLTQDANGRWLVTYAYQAKQPC